jgi:hypothetical protein
VLTWIFEKVLEVIETIIEWIGSLQLGRYSSHTQVYCFSDKQCSRRCGLKIRRRLQYY